MKKLLYLLPLLLFGCSMNYTVEYVPTSKDAHDITVDMRVVDTLQPNVYVIECYFTCDTLPINSISLVVCYDSLVEFEDAIEINKKLYINEYDDLGNLGGTFFLNTGRQLRYSFATVQDVSFSNEFIFRSIVRINGETAITFSKVPDEVEFTDKMAVPYFVKTVHLKFTKK